MRPAVRLATIGLAVTTVGVMGITALFAAVPQQPGDPARSATATQGAPPPEPASATSAPAGPEGFTASPLDVDGQVKEAAVRFVERIGTWNTPADATTRVTDAGYPPELAASAEPLLDIPAQESDVTLIYPQYGGLTDTAASVIVLVRQALLTASGEVVREVLLDIRLQPAADGGWQVSSVIDPARPQMPPARPGGPTELGRAVLDNPQLEISGPARADISERRVGDPILAVVDELSRTYALDVQVTVSGHPGTVFPTTRLSNHAVGRGVDVRAVNGTPVVAIPRDDPVITEFMAAAGRAGATEVGGPIVPPGTGFFTDEVHQDHFHLGITPTKPPAAAS